MVPHHKRNRQGRPKAYQASAQDKGKQPLHLVRRPGLKKKTRTKTTRWWTTEDCPRTGSWSLRFRVSGRLGYCASGRLGYCVSGRLGYSVSGRLGYCDSGRLGYCVSGRLGYGVSGRLGYCVSGRLGYCVSGCLGYCDDSRGLGNCDFGNCFGQLKRWHNLNGSISTKSKTS